MHTQRLKVPKRGNVDVSMTPAKFARNQQHAARRKKGRAHCKLIKCPAPILGRFEPANTVLERNKKLGLFFFTAHKHMSLSVSIIYFISAHTHTYIHTSGKRKEKETRIDTSCCIPVPRFCTTGKERGGQVGWFRAVQFASTRVPIIEYSTLPHVPYKSRFARCCATLLERTSFSTAQREQWK